ncbi:MAG TPA: hypothetical protein PKV98_04585 [Burkholderiaceae bacterium]|nr:hypothetical protein [Burkholderiaceae bacterium]
MSKKHPERQPSPAVVTQAAPFADPSAPSVQPQLPQEQQPQQPAKPLVVPAGMVAIVYVGPKAWTVDSVARTGVQWHGRGDVQLVPAAAAKRLLRFPDQWAIADGSPLPDAKTIEQRLAELQPPEAAKEPEQMNEDELIDYAHKHHAIEFTPDTPREEMLYQIERKIENDRLDDQHARADDLVKAEFGEPGGNV